MSKRMKTQQPLSVRKDRVQMMLKSMTVEVVYILLRFKNRQIIEDW